MIDRPLKKLPIFAGIILVLVISSGCDSKTNYEPPIVDTDQVPPSMEASICNSDTGLTKAVEVCTPENKCTRLAKELTDKGITEIIEPSVMPFCSTYNSPDHPFYNDGPASTVTDSRYS